MEKNELLLTTFQMTLNKKLEELGKRKTFDSMLKRVDDDWCLEFIIKGLMYRFFINNDVSFAVKCIIDNNLMYRMVIKKELFVEFLDKLNE